MGWTELCAKVTQLEALLQNHIHWHETIERYFLLPILVGIVLLWAKEIIVWHKGKRGK